MIIFAMFCFLSIVMVNTDCGVCYAQTNDKIEIEITQNNFFSDFYNNTNLLGESGKNYIVKFNEDINLDISIIGNPFYKKYVPIGQNSFFTAEIDGNNKSITNLKLNLEKQDNIAFFGNVSSRISNLTIKNFEFISKTNVAVFSMYNRDCVFENLSITDCRIYSTNSSNFTFYSDSSFYKNISIEVDNRHTENGFDFAQNFIDGGVLNVDTNSNSLSLNKTEFPIWNDLVEKEYQKAYLNINGYSEKPKHGFQNTSNTTKQVDWSIIIVFCAVFAILILALIKSFNKILTKQE